MQKLRKRINELALFSFSDQSLSTSYESGFSLIKTTAINQSSAKDLKKYLTDIESLITTRLNSKESQSDDNLFWEGADAARVSIQKIVDEGLYVNYKIAQELTDKISRLRLPFYSSLNDTVNNSESLEAYNMVVANAAKMTDIRELWNYLKTVQHVSMALPGLELADKECPVTAANSMAVERIEKILNGVGIK